MIVAVQNALNSILGNNPALNNAAGAGRVFELYIMTGIAVEMQNRGFEVWLQRSDGTRVLPTDSDRAFVQRGGAPAAVPPASAGPGNASAIGLRRPNDDAWELWNGVEFRGRSGARDEVDIALVPAAVGNQLRINGGTPFGRPRVAIECKDAATSGSIDEMRTFVARLYDLTVLMGHQPHLQTPPPTLAITPGSPTGNFYFARVTYWDENRHSFNAVARQSGFSSGAIAMTAYYGIEGHPSITLNSAGYLGLVDSVCDWLDTELP